MVLKEVNHFANFCDFLFASLDDIAQELKGLEYWGGGARFRILGAKGEPNSQQAHDVVMTSMRHNDVASMSF